jgi:PAS domain S-box-containing protein
MPIRQYLHDRGLGAYLAVVISLLSILLTVILVEVIGVAATNQVKSNIGNGLAELAMETADKLDRGMFERYREVRLMAERFDLVSDRTALADKRRMLEALQETYPYYAWIGMADTNGKVLVSTRKLLEGADVSGRPWFRDGFKGAYLGDVHDAALLAKLLPNPNGDPKRFVDIAFPYKDASGKVIGILGSHLSWNWAKDVEASIFKPIAARLKVESIIAGRDGVVLLGPPELVGTTLQQASFKSAGSKGAYAIERWPDGKDYLVGYAQSQGYGNYPGLGWTILVRQDVDDAFERVKVIQRHVLWSGFGLALLFSLLGMVIAKRITAPLSTLAGAAQKMQAGETVSLPRGDGGYYEISSLTNALDALVTDLLRQKNALAELNATLERRVEDRTRELEHALDTVRLNERRIQTIIDTAQDAYIAADLSGRVIDWNSTAERMFGWRKEEAIGRPLGDLIIPVRFRPSYNATLSGLNSANPDIHLGRRLERMVVDREGREFPIEVTIGMVNAGGLSFFSSFLHDISERKKVERMKNEFISTVSHELRTPLTSIRASLAMLADDMAGELPADAKGLVSIANSSCERLVRLVNDMLDIEKIESGNMKFDIFEQTLQPVIEHAIAAIGSLAAEYRVTLSCDCPPDLHAAIDHDRFMQVVTNLLSNAIKFSPEGADVAVKAQRTDSGVRISVIDHGTGIPVAFHHRIFGKFAQADSTDSRRQGGTGLGLSICKSIVELHGGKISFDSEEGKGTVFHVDLAA